jgi:hypothetical protein
VADVWGALAQSNPSATTLTDAYTVPAAKHATVEVVACNRGTAATIRLSHAIAGAANTAAQYLLYDHALDAAASKVTAKFTVKATDVIRVYASSADVAFNVNGIEEDD